MVSNMSSLMDLVSQNQPHFQTHQALLVIGLQNDFVLPDGRLPVNVKKGFLERIQVLIPKFRELNGNVIWVQTLYEADRVANDPNTGEGDALVVGGLIDGDESGTEGGEEELARDAKDLPAQSRSSKHKKRALELLKRVSARRKTIPLEVARATAEEDDELFLLKSDRKIPACVPDTFGAQFADVIARQFELPADMVIKTTNYSAFQGTNLLMTLRARLVTELYICGCITNVSVLATVIDAARHGIKINVIEDCLGYRKSTRHDLALKRMEDFFDAYLVNSPEILARETPTTPPKKSMSPNGARKKLMDNDKPIEGLVGKMSLSDNGRPGPRPSNPRSPTKVLTGKQRTLSLVSVAESRKAIQNTTAPAVEPIVEPTIEPTSTPTDKQFADMLVRGAILPEQDPPPEKDKRELVKTRIRMRTKGKKKKKDKEKEKEGEASTDKIELSAPPTVEPSTPTRHSTAEPVTATATTAPTASPKPSPAPTESKRTSLLARAGSIASLRERSRQHSLKNVSSVPVLTTQPGSEDKERNRLSDLVTRMSLSRAPKSDSGFESKKGLGLGSAVKDTKGGIGPSKGDDEVARRLSVQSSLSLRMQTPGPAPTVQAPAPQPSEVQVPTRPAPTTATPPSKPSTMGKASKLQSLASFPVLGPGDKIAEGDSRIINDFFPAAFHHPTDPSKPLKDLIFTQLYNEVQWQRMLHQQGEVPRLVCCQGAFGDDGSMPVYRHPTDQALPLLHFSPKVNVIRKQAEKLVGHPLNHVLIQLYRSGNDYISEHSDKTLDIVKGSSIVNVSFGAQRTMRLRTKKVPTANPEEKSDETTQRETQRVAMPHNSMFVLGLKSNEKWLHGIMADKRLQSERSATETAYNGIRISLTFRHIGTFLDARESVIWGQGATAKEKDDAADIINGDATESEIMIRAFSRENHNPNFAWAEHYGAGFDVLHLHAPPPADLPLLFASHNAIETAQAAICLAECKIKYTLIPAPALEPAFEIDRQVTFRDTDTHHTQVSMSSSIIVYLDKHHPFDTNEAAKPCTAQAYPIMILTAGVVKAWVNRHVPTYTAEFERILGMLEDVVASDEGPFVAGRRFSVADCFVWPVVDAVARGWDGWDGAEGGKYGSLGEWYRMVERRKASVKKVKGEMLDVKKADAGGAGKKNGGI